MEKKKKPSQNLQRPFDSFVPISVEWLAFIWINSDWLVIAYCL